jgi:hypothetical protein
VKVDVAEVERRWHEASGRTVRVRELSEAGESVLTVDFDEPAGYFLWALGIGRLLVKADGSEVLCAPDPGNADWAMILPAQALPLAATLSGLEVFHAAGLVLGGSAVLLSGDPGAGKSSLAAALLGLGAGMLSDDCVAIEAGQGGLVAHPGAGILYLRPAEQGRLDAGELGALGPATEFAGKHRFRPGAEAAAVPLDSLFLLERTTDGPVIEPIEDVDPFLLLAATFNLSVRTPERLVRQLDVAQELAATGRVHRLRILPEMDATQVAGMVAEHARGAVA